VTSDEREAAGGGMTDDEVPSLDKVFVASISSPNGFAMLYKMPGLPISWLF
jgi:hypothetical protein